MGDNTPLKLCFDAFELDEKNARLSQNGQPISLPPKAFAVLCALARQSGQLVTKSELLDVVWGHQHVSESVLKTIISELRVVLSDSAKQPRFVETASRRGYRFIAAIRPWSARDVPFAESALPDLRVRPVTERVETSPMIGRQATLDQLHAAWNNTIAGRRQIFWVAGEAGVGKTTLIDNFVAELGPNTYAYGQCVEQYGAGEPYLPVLEAVGVLCRNDPSLIPLLRAIAPTWLLQLPWLISETEREVLRRELAGMGHERMLRELGELLERYTLQQPLLLVTEDLHWSDHATIHLIDHIARRRGSMRLMWLASFRLAEVIAEDHPLKSLRHELRLHRLCDEIVLDPFSEQDLADYIGNRFPGSEVSEPFVRALHVRTDGLPLFVVNVIDDLATLDIFQSSATEPAGEIILPTQVPENLAGVIEKQIARLSPEQQELLEAASVCGMEFWPSTLGDALARDASWAAQHCNELARRQNWLSEVAVDQQPNGKLNMRYAFRHALYRQVFYQRIGSLARSQLHRRIAVSLESSRAAGSAVTAAELASHFELSHDLAAALRYLTEAIDHALRHFAPREALVLSTHALSLLSRSPVDSQRDALELALTAMRGVAAAQLFGVSSLDAKGAFERAKALLEVLPEHPLRSLVLHALGLVLLVRGEYAEARALSERIYELSEKYADPILLLSACSVLGQIHTLQGRQQDGREYWSEASQPAKHLATKRCKRRSSSILA